MVIFNIKFLTEGYNMLNIFVKFYLSEWHYIDNQNSYFQSLHKQTWASLWICNMKQ